MQLAAILSRQKSSYLAELSGHTSNFLWKKVSFIWNIFELPNKLDI